MVVKRLAGSKDYSGISLAPDLLKEQVQLC